VHHVTAEVARASLAQDRIHVRAVDVNKAADAVQHVGDSCDIAFEEPERVRVGHHKDGGPIVDLCLQLVKVYESIAASGELDAFKSSQRRAGGVRAVSAGWEKNSCALFTAVFEVCGGSQQGCEFSLSSGGRMQGDPGQSGDFGEHALHFEEDTEQSLNLIFRLIRMTRGGLRQASQSLVSLGVVLHRATAERIEVRIDAHIQS